MYLLVKWSFAALNVEAGLGVDCSGLALANSRQVKMMRYSVTYHVYVEWEPLSEALWTRHFWGVSAVGAGGSRRECYSGEGGSPGLGLEDLKKRFFLRSNLEMGLMIVCGLEEALI